MIQSLPLFGSPLVTALARSSFTTSSGLSVPGILARCYQEIEQKGLDVEGLFRKSGSTAIINELQLQFEESQNPFLVKFPLTITSHSLTGLFKRYLQQLPEPVIPRQYQSMFLDVFDQERYSKETLKRRLKEVCKKLPHEHLHLLQFLIEVTDKVQQHQERNQMSIESLAIIFAPTCIRLDGVSQFMLGDNAVLTESKYCQSYNSLPVFLDKRHLIQKARQLLWGTLKKKQKQQQQQQQQQQYRPFQPSGNTPPMTKKKKKRYSASSSLFSGSLKYKPNELLQLELIKESNTWIKIFEFMMTYPEVFTTLTNPLKSQQYNHRQLSLKEHKNTTIPLFIEDKKDTFDQLELDLQQQEKLSIDVNTLEFKESRELVQTFESFGFSSPKVDRLPTPKMMIRKTKDEAVKAVSPVESFIDTPHSKYIRTLQNWKLREEENPNIIVPQEVMMSHKFKRNIKSKLQSTRPPQASDWVKAIQGGVFSVDLNEKAQTLFHQDHKATLNY